MKTPAPLRLPFPHAGRFFNAITGACVLLASSSDAAPAHPATSPTNASAAPPYAIYMGTDIAVEWQGQMRPLRDVEGTNFVIEVDGKTAKVPSRSHDLKIKLEPMIKVSPAALTVTDFKPERVYTPDADPNRQFGQAGALALGAAAAADFSQAKANAETRMTGWMQAHPANEFGIGFSPSQIAAQQANADQATADSVRAYQEIQNPIYSAGDASGRAAIEASREAFDAFRLNFRLAAAEPVTNAYAVVILRLQPDPNAPNSLMQWVYAEKLSAIGTTPSKFEIYRDGFPPGYKLVDTQLHIYQGGVELDTTVARKRKTLTADEAFQFSVADYTLHNHGATLDALPNHKFVPPDLRQNFPTKGSNHTLYVKVAKNGFPVSAFTDQGCTQKVLESDIESAVMRLRFNPALDKGKPVEGVAVLRPAEI